MAAFIIVLIMMCLFFGGPIIGLLSIFFGTSNKNSEQSQDTKVMITSPLSKFASKSPEASVIVKRRLNNGDYSKIITKTEGRPKFSELRNSDYNKPLKDIIVILNTALNQSEPSNAYDLLSLVLPYHIRINYRRRSHSGIADYFEEKTSKISRGHIAKLIVMSGIEWSEIERAAVHMFKLSMIDVDFATMCSELEKIRGSTKQWFMGLAHNEFINSDNYYGGREIIADSSSPIVFRATDKAFLIEAKNLKNYFCRPGE